MARYNQTAIQDMLDGLRAAKAQIDALTKERDEARSEMHRQRELWGEKCNELADANERIAALEKALNVTFTMLRHVQTDVPLNCTERIDVERAIDIVRAALAGRKKANDVIVHDKWTDDNDSSCGE